ncbi:MAG: hypothetical protein ABFS32_10990 [Bacteroidota bacterium]
MNIKETISINYHKFQTYITALVIRLKKSKAIVLTGCGRSGTRYSSKLLRKCGLHIGHEKLFFNGISSWRIVSDSTEPFMGPSFNEIKMLDRVMIHQVREPLSSISSMLTIGKPSWEFIAKEIPVNLDKDSSILKAMKYYFYWNLKAETITDYRVKAETFSDDIRPILIDQGITFNDKLNDIKAKDAVNTRKHQILTWEDLNKEDPDLTGKIRLLGTRYGYDN